TPDTYTFIWRGVPAVIEADVPLFVRVYTTRMYGACFGMMAIPEHDLIHQDSNLEVTWYIKIPFTAGSKDLGRVA
ncbi:MAG TPA: hypothetical protein VFK30_08760, partial [Anaerolineae bacterium]|nr:hypothetical protein [Anaerolineae bacterium]